MFLTLITAGDGSGSRIAIFLWIRAALEKIVQGLKSKHKVHCFRVFGQMTDDFSSCFHQEIVLFCRRKYPDPESCILRAKADNTLNQEQRLSKMSSLG